MRAIVLLVSLLAAVPQSHPARESAPSPEVDAARVFRDVEVLAADGMEGRLAGSEGGRRARDYVRARLTEAGVVPLGTGFDRTFSFRPRLGVPLTGTNLVGVVRGRRDAPWIVVTAHYDHIGIRNGTVYNGADDNASGVAALLALATYFAHNRPDHPILVAALDAEESGLQGASALLRDPPVPIRAMALTVNLDMVGRDETNRLFASGPRHWPFLRPYLEGVARPPVQLLFGHDGEPGQDDWTSDSDHYPFHKAGIPYVYFGVEDAAQHHRATDDAETIGKAFLAGAAGTVIAAVRVFDAHLEEIVARTPGR